MLPPCLVCTISSNDRDINDSRNVYIDHAQIKKIPSGGPDVFFVFLAINVYHSFTEGHMETYRHRVCVLGWGRGFGFAHVRLIQWIDQYGGMSSYSVQAFVVVKRKNN